LHFYRHCAKKPKETIRNQKKSLKMDKETKGNYKKPKTTKRNQTKPSKLSKKPKTTKRNHQKLKQGIFSFVF